MNILLDARAAISYLPGVKRYVSRLGAAMARALPESGDTLSVIVHDKDSLPEIAGPGVKRLVCDLSPFDPRQARAIADIAAAVKPDVFHTPFYTSPSVPGVPAVLTMHDCVPMMCPSETSSQERLLFRRVAHEALRACTLSISVSETTRHDCLELFPDIRGKFRTIPHGVEEAFAPQSAERHEAVAAAYGLTRPYLLYLGSNRPHKNLATLLAGYVRAKPLLQGRSLVLAGAACEPQRRDQEFVRFLGLETDVRWPGRIASEDVPALLSGADALVLPSFYEGFGLPVLEAMACGTPVICSNAPGLRELGGNSVVYFDPASEEDLAQALLSGLGDSDARRRRVADGRSRASLYRWDNVLASTRSVYQEAITRFAK